MTTKATKEWQKLWEDIHEMSQEECSNALYFFHGHIESMLKVYGDDQPLSVVVDCMKAATENIRFTRQLKKTLTT
jgi:hypothetical protein